MRRQLHALTTRARRARAVLRGPSSDGAVVVGESVAAGVARQAIADAVAFGDDCDDEPRLPVVMCVWDRLDRLPRTLRSIQHSVGVRAEIFLWNNRSAEADRVLRDARAACASSSDTGTRVTVATSAVNIGGFGRFYWARRLAARRPFVVFLDDDQMLDPFSLAELAAEARPRALRAVWAYRFENRTEYWRRSQVRPGEPAHYLGTGGMVADTSIFLDDAVFGCPAPYWFIEDLWLSHYAHAELGWSLRRSHAEIGMIFDGRNQYRALRQAKDDFYRLLAQDPRWLDDGTPRIPAQRGDGAPPGRY
jgi:hypothetical protein